MENEAILNISLKDYKKEIDDLRASLLGLNKDSEQYKETASEIAKMQQNLNEVMQIGKKDADAVDGSYAQLSQTMSELKKQWRTMEIGTDEWSELGQRINEINNELKDADASVGVFSRNVGNYQQAFEEAFKNIGGSISANVDGPLGTVVGDIVKMIPLIKASTKAATAGLKGVKAALASTGIGLLVIAVGELVAHWDDLMKIFRKGKGDVEEITKANENLEKTFKEQDKAMSNQVKIMEAQGKSTKEIIAEKKRLIKTQIAETEATMKGVQAKMAEIRAHSAFRRWISGENKDYKAMQKEIDELTATLGNLKQSYTDLEVEEQVDGIKKGTEAWKAQKKALDDILERLRKNSKSEIDLLTEKYNKEKALLEKFHKDTTALTEEYQKNINSINSRGLMDIPEFGESQKTRYEKIFDAIEDARKKVEEAKNRIKYLENNYTADLEEELMTWLINKASSEEELSEAIRNYYTEWLKDASERYDNFITLFDFDMESIEVLKADMDNYISKLSEMFGEDYANEFRKAIDKAYRDFAKNGPDAVVSLYKGIGQAFENGVNELDKEKVNITEMLRFYGDKIIPDPEDLQKAIEKVRKAFSDGVEELAGKAFESELDLSKYRKSLEDFKEEYKGFFENFIGKPFADEKAIAELKKRFEEEKEALNKKFEEEKKILEAAHKSTFELEYNHNIDLLQLETKFKKDMKKASEQGMQDDKTTLLAQLGFVPLENEKQELESRKRLYSEYLNFLKVYKEEIIEARLQLFKDNNTGATAEEIRVERDKIAFQVERETKDKQLEFEKGYAEAEKAIIDYRIDNWMSLAGSISDITGSIADMLEIQIENEKNRNIEAGMAAEDAEKIAEKQYKRVQALQIAEATINTISGALTALMQAQKLGFPMGAIVGAAQAAALTAAGIAEIMKIKQTDPYSNSSAASSSASASYTAPVNVTPVTTNYNPDYTANLTGNRETEELRKALSDAKIRAYVVESDITGKQKLASIRKNESTF